ncbi:MAG TPA: DUF2630 family protein [Micromonosporaceae bacterium]
MDEKAILARIGELVDEEHHLRTAVQAGELGTEEEHDRLRSVEQALDQCWDLLRRRRAAQDTKHDPDTVQTRSVAEVESYLQ